MPLYEYQCTQCGQRTEALQRLGEAPLKVCPHCGGELRKLLSAPAFQFKGSGWYKTDYAEKKAGAATGATGAAAGEAKTSGEAAAESKSTEKSDAGTKSDKPAAVPPKSSSS